MAWKVLLASAPAFVALALPSSASMQQPQREPQREERPGLVRGAEEQREQARRAEAARTPDETQLFALRRTMFVQERNHRHRLARIDRLLAIFRERRDTEKVAKLEELTLKENQRYGAWIDKQRATLGPAEFAKVSAVIERGRVRGEARPAGSRPALRPPERTPPPDERSERERQQRPPKGSSPRPPKDQPSRPGRVEESDRHA